MNYLKGILLVMCLILNFSCVTTAPPVEGYTTACGSISPVCTDIASEKKVCETIAPAGYYWEALPPEESGDVYRCPYELRRFVPKTETSNIQDQPSTHHE